MKTTWIDTDYTLNQWNTILSHTLNNDDISYVL